MLQKPRAVAWGLRLIVGPAHLTPFSLLRLQFHGGLKTIDIHPQRPVELRQLSVGEFSREAIIADHLPNNLPVLLLHVTLIIAASWAPEGYGDLLLFTKGEQVGIDKLRSIIRVNAQDRKGEQVLSAFQRSNDCLLAFVEQRKAFSPSGSNIGEGQGTQERSVGMGPAMSDQIGFQKTWLDVVPLLERADRDLLFEQRP